MPLRIAPYQQQTSLSVVGAPRASAPSVVDPTGAAVQQLAGTVMKIGADMYQVQREADLQDRVGKFTAEVSALELEFDRDQEFRTAPDRFNERANALRDKYLDGVTDNGVATAFRKQAQTLTLAKSINVRKDAWKKEGDYNVASLDSNIDTYANAAANAKNPAEAAIVENQARLAIASAQSGGWLTAVDAGKRERTFLTKRDSAVVIRDMGIDPMLTATKLSIDTGYVANLDPVARERYADQAFRRAESETRQHDAAAERERKARGDELMKEALNRQNSGTLTSGYVEQIRPFVEPTEYKSLLAGLSGADRKDDPQAFSDLQGLVYTNPAEAERQAFIQHRNGRIRNETLTAVLTRAREISRQEGPRTAYERERLFITNAIKPSDLVRDPSGSARYALVIREYDDYAMSGQRTDAELREKADAVLKKYTMVDMVELARQTASGAKPTPEMQLKSINEEAQRLMADRAANKITQQVFNQKMEPLNRLRKAAEKAAGANGGK